jgi:integrase
MPHIKFTDSKLKTLSADKTTWFTDPSCKGLRLCVTKGGVKTWYVNKWDPTSNKTRSVKLAQWATQGTHCRWAKDQVGKIALDITTGNVRTREETELEKNRLGIPTFREALEQYIEHRTTARASGKARMMEATARDYRLSFNLHLGPWADVHVDELPILEINQYLNALQITRPHSARIGSVVAGAVVRFINRLCALALPIPSLLDNTIIKSRVQTGKLDMSVPWVDRKAEIDAIKNEHIRLAWMITWYTGFRGRSLRALTWDQVDLVARTVTFDRLKRQEIEREIVIADDVVRLFKRLHDIRQDDCNWVFPSRRVVSGTRGHLDVLDRLPTTAAGDLRHLWMSTAREVAPRHVHRWLAQQTMTDDDLRMLGHYGEPSHEEQRRSANAIASAINIQLGVTPSTVVALKRKRA